MVRAPWLTTWHHLAANKGSGGPFRHKGHAALGLFVDQHEAMRGKVADTGKLRENAFIVDKAVVVIIVAVDKADEPKSIAGLVAKPPREERLDLSY